MKHDQMEKVGANVESATQAASQVDTTALALDLADTVVKSGLIEQFGTELGASGAAIAAAIGLYWKFRKKNPEEEAAVSEAPAESESVENESQKIAEEEVNRLQNIEEQQTNGQKKEEN
tara:strand:- start:1636 stop:1992 length:357 start_codon:yes stop_codon:yes gene_type:complete